MLGADRGHRAGAHVGDAAGIEERLRYTGARIEQRQDRKLGRETELVVVDEVADDFDARGIDGRLDGAAQHVEMAVGHAGLEMYAGFDHGFAPALTGEARFDRRQDFVVGDLEFVDVEAVEIGDVERRPARTPPTLNMFLHFLAGSEKQLFLAGFTAATDRYPGLPGR